MSLYKAQNGKWRYHFQHNGQRFTKSGFDSKKAAREAEADHRSQVVNGQEKTGPESLALSSLIFEYLEANRSRLAEKTWNYKRFVFQHLLDHLGKDVPVKDITPLVIDSYLRTRPSGYNANFHRKDLGALFNWGMKCGLCTGNPALQVERFKDDVRRRVVPKPEDIAKVFMAAGENRPFLKVMFYTLARKSEVLTMKWRDIDFARNEITLWTRKRRGGNLEPDQFPMHPDLRKILVDLASKRGDNEYVFVNPDTGTRFMNRPKIMGTLCKRTGIQHFSFHALRHYAASWLYENGVSMKSLQYLLRHQSIATTERYLHRMDKNMHDAISTLPNPEEMVVGS